MNWLLLFLDLILLSNATQINAMEDYIGKWLYYPWLLGSSDIDLIHPDDREINGLGIAKCIGVEEEYNDVSTI